MSLVPSVERQIKVGEDMISKHLSTVLRIIEFLSRRGVKGRADHVGKHRFQKKDQGLFIGRFRPDILITEGSVKIVVEVVCPPVLRGGRLVDALSYYKGTGYIVIVIAPNSELEALQTALGLMGLEPYLTTNSIDICSTSILSMVKDASNTVQKTFLDKENEP